MTFSSKPEAYLYCLYLIDQIQKETAQHRLLNEASYQIRQLLNHHEQDPKKASRIIQDVIDGAKTVLSPVHQAVLMELIQGLDSSDYQQTTEEKYDNPLGRRLESELQIALAFNPTDSMMRVMKKMSDRIVTFLDEYPNEYMKSEFLYYLTQESHPAIAFGSWEEQPTREDITEMLKSNKPEDFIKIMFVHFKFAQAMARRLHETESDKKSAPKISGIADTRMYDSPLYRSDRGRDGHLRPVFSQRMGILKESSGLFSDSLPKDKSTWIPDAKGQAANLRSPFTRDLVENDTPYVAGPSGMTSMLIGQYLGYLEETTSLAEKQLYISAIGAYIVSGGFHCLHEVLGPIAHCLKKEGLLPGYEFSLPQANKLGAPPNYDYFYKLIKSIDPRVSSVLDKGWEKMNGFMAAEYVPACHNLSTYEEAKKRVKQLGCVEEIPGQHQEMLADVASTMPAQRDYRAEANAISQMKQLKQDVLAGIDSYQHRKKPLFRYWLNPDRNRGIIRANSYKRLLEDATDDFTILCIVGAMFSSKDAPTLQGHVYKQCGYEKKSKMRDYLRESFTQLKSKYSGRGNDFSEKVNENIILIAKAADSKKTYQDIDHKGEYESPLDRLKEVNLQIIKDI